MTKMKDRNIYWLFMEIRRSYLEYAKEFVDNGYVHEGYVNVLQFDPENVFESDMKKLVSFFNNILDHCEMEFEDGILEVNDWNPTFKDIQIKTMLIEFSDGKGGFDENAANAFIEKLKFGLLKYN